MARRLTPRGVERREQLLRVSARLFAESGYHRTSVADIVTTCRVGKGVFYWYFDSKEELFLAILEDALQALRRSQRKAIEDEPDPVARIVKGIRATMDFLAAHADRFRLFEFAATDTDFATTYHAGIETAVEDTARHVKEAMSDGFVPDGDPYFLAHGITTVTMTFFRRFMLAPQEGEHMEHGDVVEAAVDFCLHGMAAPR